MPVPRARRHDTPGDLRHLPGENGVGRALPGAVVARPGAAGLLMRDGSVAGATIVGAPGPPEDASGSRDPGTRQAERGSRWRLGTRCHPGKDAGSGHADATWRGVARREKVHSDPHPSGTGWRVAMGPSKPGAARRARRDGRGEERSRGLHAREGKRPCQIARRTLGYAKVRYRGIARGASARPRPARQRQPARVRQGGQAGGAPGGLRGGRLTAAGGTGVPRGRPEGPREGPGTPEGGRRGPNMTKNRPIARGSSRG